MWLLTKSQQNLVDLAGMRFAFFDVTSDQKANHDTDQVFHLRRHVGPQTATMKFYAMFGMQNGLFDHTVKNGNPLQAMPCNVTVCFCRKDGRPLIDENRSLHLTIGRRIR